VGGAAEEISMYIDGLTIAGIISVIPIVVFILVFGRTLPEEPEEQGVDAGIDDLDCCAVDR
jgi:hypothetical protein